VTLLRQNWPFLEGETFLHHPYLPFKTGEPPISSGPMSSLLLKDLRRRFLPSVAQRNFCPDSLLLPASAQMALPTLSPFSLWEFEFFSLRGVHNSCRPGCSPSSSLRLKQLAITWNCRLLFLFFFLLLPSIDLCVRDKGLELPGFFLFFFPFLTRPNTAQRYQGC